MTERELDVGYNLRSVLAKRSANFDDNLDRAQWRALKEGQLMGLPGLKLELFPEMRVVILTLDHLRRGVFVKLSVE